MSATDLDRTTSRTLTPLGMRGVDLGLLLARLGLGVVMFVHGWQKVVTNGLGATTDGFRGMGAPLPEVSAVFASFVELIGGALLIAGIGVRIVGVLMVVDMVGAIFIVHAENGFFATNGGYEFVLLLAVVAGALALTGGGRYSVDRFINAGRRARA